MPFTFITFMIGALALAGFPLTSGFFSKDEILSFTINRGGGFVVLAVFGYLAAGLTAFYAFRLVFRVFYGEPVPEAREMEAGDVAHGEPVNPLTGEPEDTDVGFPGPEHHVAERVDADAGGDGAAGAAGADRRHRRGPGRDRRDRALPRADLRGSRFADDAPERRRRVGRARRRRAGLARGIAPRT